MSLFSRDKGKRGEREACGLIKDLLGLDARRRVRQDGGDSDVLGVEGWCIEVKNCDEIRMGAWWTQACGQSRIGETPALFYKVPRKGWRVIWPVGVLLSTHPDSWLDIDYTCDTTPEAWAAVVRELIQDDREGY